MNIKKYGVAALIGSMSLTAAAQNASDSLSVDTAIHHTKSSKNLRFSVLGGPGYTPDYGLLLGGSALFTFSTNPSDPNLQRSVMPLSFGLTFAKPIGINVMLKPQLFLNHDKIRLFGTFVYKNLNDNYHGIGYDQNREIERGENTQYFASMVQLNPILMFKIRNSHFYIGGQFDFNREKLSDPGISVIDDPVYIQQGGDSTGLTIRSVGIGGVLSYDTRDVAANAYRGLYFELKGAYYSKKFGGDSDFATLQLDYRQYLRLSALGERRVLAWNVSSKNVFGDAPFTRYPLIGNPFDLRGYYQGQYRDKSTLVGIAEYRHMFNFGDESKARRFWSRFGFAAWAGVGLMGPNPVKYDAVMPNYGAGLRIELQPRMNFRLDIGRSPIDRQNLIYFNMTESF